jgi:hypothetical protein
MASVTSPIEPSLRMLLERLNWPVRMARAAAAREYAALLSSQLHGKMATTAFLHWLATRELESQVATGLAVLLCTATEDLPPFGDVCEAIRQPSIIADMLLQHIYGFANRKGEWRNAHSGVAPEDFISDKYFEDYKIAYVPQILSNEIERLDEEYWFSFSRQWAFEWRKLMDRGEFPYSDFPYHFVGNLARSGVVGQFEVAQSDVMRSAYLRTLACAVSEDAMTAQQAGFYAMHCLPINRGLFRVKPVDRPSWLSKVPEEASAAGASLAGSARKLIAENINTAGMRPVRLLTPIKASLFEFGDFTISAVMATDDFTPPEMNERYFLPSTLWPLPDAITFAGTMDEVRVERFTVEGQTGRCTPVCLHIFPMPFGYWLADYLVAGYALPAAYLFDNRPEVTCAEYAISMRADGATVAKLSIWHDHWTPLYAQDGGYTRIGMSTEMSTSYLAKGLERHGMRLGWVAQLRLWTRPNDYGEYELATRQEFFFD